MYTVVIADRTMMNCLMDYRVLFEPFEKEGSLDFCYWEPNRRDINALPDLHSLINNRLRWRALILLNPTDAYNPYDHKADDTQQPSETEEEPPVSDSVRALSSDPTVRLTQILGGMRRYVTVEEGMPAEDTSGDASVMLTPFRMKPYTVPETLQNQLRLSIHPPESINLLAMRDVSTREEWEELQKEWELQLEQRASAFWERCDYPEICRFMVFNVMEQCSALLEADVFRWWMAVLTFSLNTITPSSLQAYRLYRLDVSLDDERLCIALEKMRGRMLFLTSMLDERRSRIQSDNENTTEQELPPVNATLTLSFRNTLDAGSNIDLRQIGFCSDRPDWEEALWNQWEQHAYTRLTETLKQPRRALERASRKVREEGVMPQGPLPPCNEQVLEDLQENMENREIKIVSGRVNPLLFGTNVREELRGDAAGVQKVLHTRFSYRLLGTALAILTISLLPYILRFWLDNGLAELRYLEMGLGFLALMALIVWIILLTLRRQLTKAIRVFERHASDITQKIIDSAKITGEHLSNICSFMRGHALLNALRRSRKENADEELSSKRHRRRIEFMLALCDAWSRRFSLILQDEPDTDLLTTFDYDVPPANNSVYFFTISRQLNSIATDRSGALISVPYDFVTHFELIREEAYDK